MSKVRRFFWLALRVYCVVMVAAILVWLVFQPARQPLRCDARKITIGWTRPEVLRVCPGPSREWDDPEVPEFHKDQVFPNGRASSVQHFMRWGERSDFDRYDLVMLEKGVVTSASSRGLP